MAQTEPNWMIAEKYLGMHGGMLSGSKRDYTMRFPDHFAYFNANVITEDGEKIWYGDLDITTTSFQLFQLAKALNTTLYVLKEMDYRFDTEGRKDFKQVAVWNTNK